MDFTVSDKMQTIVEMINEFLEKEIIPLEPAFLSKPFRELLPVINEKREIVKKMELWAPNHPTEFGGMGLDLMEHALVSEALGRSPLGHFVFGCQAPDAGNIEILHKYGTKEQKDKYLAPLVEGKIRSCFSMTEVDMPGSNPVMLETTAEKEGDDYIINGHKWFSTGADGAEFAIVMAVTNPEESSPHKRASMIIVPSDTPGFNLVRNIPIMDHTGDDFFSHGEILYQSCRVPRKNLLGKEGEGFVIAQDRLGPGRIHHCMRWIGVCNRAFDIMCEYANSRLISEGRNLASKQLTQAKVAECAAEIQRARLMVLDAAWKIENLGTKEARTEISLIKFTVPNVMQQVLDTAIQIMGGLGMTDDTIVAYMWRHERGGRIYDGADEVHKSAVARQILKRMAVSG
ncbi:acyl-CoA dehydrogenase family protein [bacterium]|nr:acyl-CoA dehydrogenase family protein [bacterium]